MPRYKHVNNKLIELTGSELAELEAKEQAWKDGALDRALNSLRNKRNRLLTETDWMANSLPVNSINLLFTCLYLGIRS